MSYEAATIATDLKGGVRFVTATRALAGSLFVAHFVDNPASGPKRVRLWYSAGEGRPDTWEAESWSQAAGGPTEDCSYGAIAYLMTGDGGTDPILLADPAGYVWLACSSYGGVALPIVCRREYGQQVWAQPNLDWAHFFPLTLDPAMASPSSFDAVLDEGFPMLGCWNVAAVWIKGNIVYYTDLAIPLLGTAADQIQVDTGHANYVACRLLTDNAGNKWCFLLDSSGDLWVAEKATAGNDAWGARVQINNGTTVASLEDVCLHPCGFPCCLYRVDAGGGIHHLYHAEWSPYVAAWGSQRVWDGINNYGFFPGHSLQYDARGSIFVVGPYDHDGDADPADGHIYRWDHIRALDPGVTAWTPLDLTSGGVGGTSLCTAALKSRTPHQGSYLPAYLYQGTVAFVYVWPPAAPETEQILYMCNRDYYGTRDTNYPTIFGSSHGLPLFRPADDAVRTPAPIAPTKTPISLFPTTRPSFSYVEDRVFQTNEARFEAGYTAQVARFTSGQRVISVAFVPERKGDLDAVVEYALARQRDGRVFNWLPPDYEGNPDDALIPVRMLPAPIERETVTTAQGDRVQVIAFQMIEVL